MRSTNENDIWSFILYVLAILVLGVYLFVSNNLLFFWIGVGIIIICNLFEDKLNRFYWFNLQTKCPRCHHKLVEKGYQKDYCQAYKSSDKQNHHRRSLFRRLPPND